MAFQVYGYTPLYKTRIPHNLGVKILAPYKQNIHDKIIQK